jgi:proline iminopeptidase
MQTISLMNMSSLTRVRAITPQSNSLNAINPASLRATPDAAPLFQGRKLRNVRTTIMGLLYTGLQLVGLASANTDASKTVNEPQVAAPTDGKAASVMISPTRPFRTFFPAIEPYNTFKLKVSEVHTLHVEEAGNPKGVPVIFLHGGPGAGISPRHRQLFDPKHYRIILVDQRGSGKSEPHASYEKKTTLASIKENTTWDLVADLEQVREKLGIQKWMVFGGSWGSTLALAYGETHPERVSGMILRGICLGLPEENAWLYQERGAAMLFPDEYKKFQEMIPVAERHDMLGAYHRLLSNPDEEISKKAAKAWSRWSSKLTRLIEPPGLEQELVNDPADASVLETHYFVNECFTKGEKRLLAPANIVKLRDIPIWVINGQYDLLCPPYSARKLCDALPQAKYTLTPAAGHAFDEPATLDALIGATEAFKAMTPASP